MSLLTFLEAFDREMTEPSSCDYIASALEHPASPGRFKGGPTGLHRAALSKDGGKEFIAFLLQLGIGVNAQTYNGETALHWAAASEFDGQEKMNVLVENGANVNIRNQDGQTALHFAAESESDGKEKLSFLMGRGVCVNVQDNSRKTALHLAALSKFNGKEKMDVLVLSGASVNSQDEEGKTALHLAAESKVEGKEKIALLLEEAVDLNARDKHGRTAFHVAAMSKTEGKEKLALLLEEGVDVNIQDNAGRTALHLAAKSAFEGMEKMIFLAENGADLNARDSDGQTALHFAAMSKSGGEEKLRFLLENGVDVNVKNHYGETAFHWAAHSEFEGEQKMTVLEEFGADLYASNEDKEPDEEFDEEPNEGTDEETVLYLAAKSTFRGKEKLAFLLKKGVSANFQNRDGETALHLAAMADYEGKEKMSILVDNGAKLYVRNGDGQSALHLAAMSKFGGKEKLAFLLGQGFCVNRRNSDGETALDLAVRTAYERAEKIRVLVKNGANFRNEVQRAFALHARDQQQRHHLQPAPGLKCLQLDRKKNTWALKDPKILQDFPQMFYGTSSRFSRSPSTASKKTPSKYSDIAGNFRDTVHALALKSSVGEEGDIVSNDHADQDSSRKEFKALWADECKEDDVDGPVYLRGHRPSVHLQAATSLRNAKEVLGPDPEPDQNTIIEEDEDYDTLSFPLEYDGVVETTEPSEAVKKFIKYTNPTQWTPANPTGLKVYDRDFLLQFQSIPFPMLPNMPQLDCILSEPISFLSRLRQLAHRATLQPKCCSSYSSLSPVAGYSGSDDYDSQFISFLI